MRKKMNYFKSIYKFVIILIIININNSSGQDLKVKFYNKTGFDLDSLKIQKNFIGHLAKDSATYFLDFSSLVFDSGIPDANLFAVIDDKIITTPKIRRCGTEMKTMKKGIYEIEIVITNWGNTEAIVLNAHRK